MLVTGGVSSVHCDGSLATAAPVQGAAAAAAAHAGKQARTTGIFWRTIILWVFILQCYNMRQFYYTNTFTAQIRSVFFSITAE